MIEQTRRSTFTLHCANTTPTNWRITNRTPIMLLRIPTAIIIIISVTHLPVRTSKRFRQFSTSVPSLLIRFLTMNIFTQSTASMNRQYRKPAMIPTDPRDSPSYPSQKTLLSSRMLRFIADKAAVATSHDLLQPSGTETAARYAFKLCGTTPSAALRCRVALRIGVPHLIVPFPFHDNQCHVHLSQVRIGLVVHL